MYDDRRSQIPFKQCVLPQECATGWKVAPLRNRVKISFVLTVTLFHEAAYTGHTNMT
jgi:hypothetical protein